MSTGRTDEFRKDAIRTWFPLRIAAWRRRTNGFGAKTESSRFELDKKTIQWTVFPANGGIP